MPPIIVIATNNPSKNYIAAGKQTPITGVNFVMTLDRRGDQFQAFFKALFDMMKRGISMPVAWTKLAPQIPKYEHPNAPETIFVCGAGRIALK